MSNMGGAGSWLSQAMESVKGGAETVAPSAVSALSDTPSISDPGGLQNFGDYSNLNVATPEPGFDWGGMARSIGDTVGNVAKVAVPALKLGTGALGIYSGVKGMQEAGEQRDRLEQAQEAQMRAAAPAAAFAEQQLGAATAGQLTGPQQARIDEWKQQAKNRIRQYLASSGQLNSSAAQDWENWIERQGTAMADQALTNTAQTGIQASGVASGAASQAAQTAQGQAGGMEATIKAANDVLAQLSAVGA